MHNAGRVEGNGVTLNYRRVGEGQDVVLIHGFAANSAFWNIKILLTLARDYRVTVYDLRGHGYSSMPAAGYTSADMATDLRMLLDHLGIEKAHLVGHSFGGVVALQYAASDPERVASLTVADSRIRALQPTQRAGDWQNWPEARNNLEKLGIKISPDEKESGLMLLEMLARPEWRKRRKELEGSPLFVPFCQKGGGNHSADRWLKLLKTTTARTDLTSSAGLTEEKIAAITIPALAVYGEKSRVLPSLNKLKELLPNVRSTIVPGRGHFFPLTDPDLFIETLTGFLEETG